jgi:hypothetical protein
MKYYKIIDNIKIIRDKENIIIHKNGKQIINPTLDLILEDGWLVDNVLPYEANDEIKLSDAINHVISEIKLYDKSNSIQECYINNTPLWFDKEERVSINRRFEIEKKMGIETSKIWYNDNFFEIKINDGILFLEELELYSIKVFDTTNIHIKNVKELNSIQEVNSYDYMTGYPEKIHFYI